MARITAFIICLLLVILDVAAGILGIEAQLAQNRDRNSKVWIFECREPSYKAYKLALAAMILLSLAHAIALTLAGSICIFSKEEFARSPPNKQLAAGSLIFSWGSVKWETGDTCGFSQRHVLSIGGILCFIHGLFLVVYYVSATTTAADEDRMMRQQQRTA